MRYLFGFLCVCALGVMPMVGCGENGGGSGSGGSAGSGGIGGGSGGMPECQSPQDCDDGNACTFDQCANGLCDHLLSEPGVGCDFGGLPGRCNVSGICESLLCHTVECDDFNDCTNEMCDPADGSCTTTLVADETPCAGGTCRAGACELSDLVQPCTEQGIRNAIATGGGPYTFSCGGPKIVTTSAEIVIDNNVVLDGEGDLTVDGGEPWPRLYGHHIFSVPEGVTAELHGFTVTRGVGGIFNAGTLSIGNSTVSGNAAIDGSCLVANGQGRGGGIYNAGTLTVTGSLISGNEIVGCRSAGRGGGIDNAGTLTLTNTTVSGNSALHGGALHMTSSNSTAEIRSSTFSNNGSAGISNINGTLTFIQTIINDTCVVSPATISLDHNIESPGNTCLLNGANDLVSVTPVELNLAEQLADNGGETLTLMLTRPSVAVDYRISICDQPQDQRGVDRPQGTMCDVGAFEVQP